MTKAATEEAESERDTLALSGLRRMVLHSRDRLTATRTVPKWTYSSDAWTPAQIQMHAAHLMAEQVLTLVAECIPGGEQLSADEAAQRVAAAVADRGKQERTLQTEVKRLQEQVTKLTGNVELLTKERDNATQDAYDSAALEAEAAERLTEAQHLAKTDASAAIRHLLGETATATEGTS